MCVLSHFKFSREEKQGSEISIFPTVAKKIGWRKLLSLVILLNSFGVIKKGKK